MADAPGRGKGRKGGGAGRGRGKGRAPSKQDGERGKGGRGGESGNKGRGGRRKNHRRGGRGSSEKTETISEEERLKREEEKRMAAEVAAAEAERKRLEEEQKKLQLARDAKRKEQKDLYDEVQEAIDSLAMIISMVESRKRHRKELAVENLLSLRKDFEASKKKLKSDLRKCTAFVKKVKSGTAWTMKPADMERDIASLNLSRYVEEVAAALLEAKLKVADLPTVVSLCLAMHSRYSDFIPSLVPSLWSVIHGKSTDETTKLRRIYVRLLTEFLLNGILTEWKQMSKLIADVSGANNGYAVSDAMVVVSFAKVAGFEILSTTPKNILQDICLLKEQTQELDKFLSEGKSLDVPDDAMPKDIPQVITPLLSTTAKDVLRKIEETLEERAVTPPISEVFLQHCKGSFDTLAKSWVETHTKLQKLEKRCEQDRLLQGNLSDSREKGLADARKLKENLQKSAETLSHILNCPLPTLQDDEDDEDAGEGGPGLELWTKGEDEANDFGPFDDEETRSFYCDIPDLLTTIPPALLGMTDSEIQHLQEENLRKYGAGSEVMIDDGSAAEVDPIAEPELEEEEEDEPKDETNTTEENEENKDTPHFRLQVLLEQELPECNRREQVDELAEKFCVNHGSSKNSRKRLTKALFQVPRTRLDLLPYYSRIAAAMDRIYPDVVTPLATDLEQQFHGQAKFKKQQNLESRLKTARYLGELTKFRVAPPIVSLRCLRRCLDDFSGFNIDVACCMLESCGRFLYRTKHTVAKLASLMDVMMRLSKAKNLDERYQALINSAFYMVKPPTAAPRRIAKVYPPLEAYLRYLLLVRLEPVDSSISFVTKQLLKFPWNDSSKACGALICKYMLKACRKGRYKAIAAVAAVAAGIRRNKPEVASRLIDACLEEIQWAMEHPTFRDQQRTITYARLLGEMNTVSLVTGPIIIQQLYNFLNFGHEIPDALREVSIKQISEESEQTEDNLPVYNSAIGVSRAIIEDEEMDDDVIESKVEEVEMPKSVAVSCHSVYDPRVPSPIDPPDSVFRVKLVCTLLEASLKNIVTRSNLSSLEGLVTSFQRYLFTKPSLPAEVEFLLLDTFDLLDSEWKRAAPKERRKVDSSSGVKQQGFPRFESWFDAHNATVAREEEVSLAENRNRARLEALAGVSEGNFDDILHDDDMVIEDEDYDGSDVDESDSEDETDDEDDAANSNADEDEYEIGEDDMEDEEESEEETDEDDEEEDYEEDDEEFDEEAYMKNLEEEAFERELRRVTIDALEKGKNAARAASHGKVADYMPSGSQFTRKKQAEITESENTAVALGGAEGVSFQLLKKGSKGKVEAKQLVVPKDTNLAKIASKHDDEADREHDIIKARVLQYEADSAEQEHSGGNVYLEQTKLQIIRNRPLSMEDIDRNFGTSRGEKSSVGEGRNSQAGRGPGRGGGRGRGGRTIKHF